MPESVVHDASVLFVGIIGTLMAIGGMLALGGVAVLVFPAAIAARNYYRQRGETWVWISGLLGLMSICVILIAVMAVGVALVRYAKALL